MVKKQKFTVVIETKVTVEVPFLENAPDYAEKEVVAIIKRFITARGEKVDEEGLLKALNVHPDWVELPAKDTHGSRVEIGYASTEVHVS